MPNVTIKGAIDLRQIIIRRPDMFLRDADGIKRVSEYYINTECSRVLLEALVIEKGKKQQFFIQVCKKLAFLTQFMKGPEKKSESGYQQHLWLWRAQRLFSYWPRVLIKRSQRQTSTRSCTPTRRQQKPDHCPCLHAQKSLKALLKDPVSHLVIPDA